MSESKAELKSYRWLVDLGSLDLGAVASSDSDEPVSPSPSIASTEQGTPDPHSPIGEVSPSSVGSPTAQTAAAEFQSSSMPAGRSALVSLPLSARDAARLAASSPASQAGAGEEKLGSTTVRLRDSSASSTASQKESSILVDAIDPAMTVVRFTFVMGKLNFGAPAGWIANFTSSNLPAGIFTSSLTVTVPFLIAHLAYRDIQRNTFNSNPYLLFTHLQQLFKKTSGAEGQPLEALNKLLQQIQLHLDDTLKHTAALNKNYASIRLLCVPDTLNNNQRKFYLQMEEKPVSQPVATLPNATWHQRLMAWVKTVDQAPEGSHKKRLKRGYIIVNHLDTAVFLCSLFYWLTWITGALITRSLDFITPGLFWVSLLFGLVLPMLVTWHIYGKKTFNFIYNHHETDENHKAYIDQVNYKYYKEEKGLFEFIINGFISFIRGLYLLNPLRLLAFYKKVGKKLPQEKLLSSDKQEHASTALRGTVILAKYQQAKEKLKALLSADADFMAEEKTSSPIAESASEQPTAASSVTTHPSLKAPGILATVRYSWLAFIDRVAKFEYQAWVIAAAFAYFAHNNNAVIANGIYASLGLGFTFLAVSVLIAISKTWAWRGKRKEDIKEARASNETLDQIIAANDALIAQIATKKTAIALLKKQNASSIPEPDIIDATDFNNLLDPKLKKLPSSALEDFFSSPYFIAFSAIALFFLNSLFPARLLFAEGTGVTTPIFHLFTPLIELSGAGEPAWFTLGALLVFAVMHGTWGRQQKNAESKFTDLAQRRTLAPSQNQCLTEQLEVLKCHEKALKAAPHDDPSGKDALPSPEGLEQPLLTAEAAADDLYPDPEWWNLVIQKKWHTRATYFIAWLALIGAFMLPVVTFVPFLATALSASVVFNVGISLVAIGLVTLLSYRLIRNSILNTIEKRNTLLLAIGLVTLSISLLFFYQTPIPTTITFYFFLAPVFMIALLFTTTFNPPSNTLSIVQNILSANELKTIFPENLTTAKLLVGAQREQLRHLLAAMLMAINPNSNQSPIIKDSWESEEDRSSEQQLVYDFYDLQRLLGRADTHQPISYSDQLKIHAISARFKNCQTKLAPTIRPTLTAGSEKRVDYACVLFILLLALIAAILPPLLSAPLYAQYIMALAIPVLLIVKSIADHTGSDDNRGKNWVAQGLSPRFLTRWFLRAAIIAAVEIIVMSLAGLFGANLGISAGWLIAMPLLSLAAIPLLWRCLAIVNSQQPKKISQESMRILSFLIGLVAISLPAVMVLLMIGAFTVPTTVGLIMTLTGLPLAFFFLKILLPKAMMAGKVMGAEEMQQIERGCLYAAYALFGVMAVICAVLIGVDFVPFSSNAVWIAGAWTAGLLIGNIPSPLKIIEKNHLAIDSTHPLRSLVSQPSALIMASSYELSPTLQISATHPSRSNNPARNCQRLFHPPADDLKTSASGTSAVPAAPSIKPAAALAAALALARNEPA